MDANDPKIRELAQKIGLKIDEKDDMREPQMVFHYKGEFFHWNHGWMRHHKVKVLHWINKIIHPFKDIHTMDQCELFMDAGKELREVTDFFMENEFQ